MDKEAFWGFLVLALIVGIVLGFSFQNTITASVISSASDVYGTAVEDTDAAPKCSDSDGGLNIYSQGICVDIEGRKYQDYCLYPDCTGLAECGSDLVVEYGCVEGKCYPYRFKCSYGCSYGVCLTNITNKTQAPTQTTTQATTQTATQTEYNLHTQTQTQETTQTTTVWDAVAGFFGIDTSKEEKEPSAEATMPTPGMYESGFYEQAGTVAIPTAERIAIANAGITYEAILNMLNNCRLASVKSTDPPQNPFLYGEHTCDELCEYYEKQNYWVDMGSLTCIFGFMHVAGPYAWSGHIDCGVPWEGPSNSTLYTEFQCYCCSPPQITATTAPVQQQTYSYSYY